MFLWETFVGTACPISRKGCCLLWGGMVLSSQVTQVIRKPFTESDGFDVLGDKPQIRLAGREVLGVGEMKLYFWW